MSRLRQINYRQWRGGLLLGLFLSIALSFSTSSAAQLTAQLATPCAPDEAHCRLSGGFSAVSVAEPAAGASGVTHPSTPMSGALIYADFVLVEQRARALLEKGLRMREAISPYRDNNDFDNFLRKLNAKAGWESDPLPNGGNVAGYSATSFTNLVNQIETDLTEARDLYAFLTVFGPEARFRADDVQYPAANNSPAYNYKNQLCANPEDPNPKSNPEEPTVLPPVIDWCNFRARLRQSVREVVNVRMIVGQEFMVDALGVNFSALTFGGEELVKREVAQLRASRFQFEKAEQFLSSGLKKAVGNGCLISDFYTQAEWSLLSRAAERQGNTQYHIATRESYLNVGVTQGVLQAQATAQRTFRQSANDAHIKLIGLAGMGAPTNQRCQIGERPDGDVVAEMALNQLETKRQSQEMAAGLNIFGFDVTMTPARPYISRSPRNCDTLAQGDRGLWDEAWCSAKLAEVLQTREENKTRAFDTSQEKLNESLNTIRLGLDIAIDDVAGCLRSNFTNDDQFLACAEEQSSRVRECWELAAISKEVNATTLDRPAEYTDGVITKYTYPNFEACVDRDESNPPIAYPGYNQQNDFDTALNAMRSDYLAWQAVVRSAENILKQIQNSAEANATVTKWLGIAGGAETAARAAQSVFDVISCEDNFKLKGIACVVGGAVNTAAQSTAGALSTAADIEFADAETKKEIKNLMLQMGELYIDAQSARQTFLSTQSDVGGLIGYFNRTTNEAKRQRAYFAASPANDPSFRIVRDSARLELAAALERAARISYLAARRAEYEYAARLSASNFRISDIYRARTAQDILTFLKVLQEKTSPLAGSATRDITPIDLKISVAQDILLLTDDLLRSEGFTTPELIAAERTRRFRIWVSENTVRNRFTEPKDGKPVLRFNFGTSLLNGGLFSNVFSQAYGNHWLLKLTGIGTPNANSNGVNINLVSEEGNLSHRKVVMSQGGLVHMSSLAGCVFDYRLIAPAKLLGSEWPDSQDAESVTATFNANVNNSHALTENGYRSPGFDGQAVSATDWEIIVFAGTPQASLGLPDMDLQKLTDIELNLSVVYGSRSDSYNGPPPATDCARIDY